MWDSSGRRNEFDTFPNRFLFTTSRRAQRRSHVEPAAIWSGARAVIVEDLEAPDHPSGFATATGELPASADAVAASDRRLPPPLCSIAFHPIEPIPTGYSERQVWGQQRPKSLGGTSDR